MFGISLPTMIVAALVAIGAALGGGYIKGRIDGASITAARYERAAVVERERQAKANEKARKEGDAIVADLEEKNRELTDQLVDHALAAASDPAGSRPAISAAGSVRLNKIR